MAVDTSRQTGLTLPAQAVHTGMMTRLTADDVLRIPHLSSLSRADAERLAPEFVVRTYPGRDLVAREGEPSRGFFQMLTGRARLFRSGPEGREQIMRLLQPGDTFGEVAIFDKGPTPATVETLEESVVLLVPAALFRLIVETQPSVALELLQYFSKRLRGFTELVEQISLQTVPQRVARYIYLTAREEGTATPDGIVVPRSITLQDMAALVGSVREVVSRTLHVFETEGIVEVRRKEILVRDLSALQRLL